MISCTWGGVGARPDMSATSKDWGRTTVLHKTPMVEVHRIEVQPGMRCSLHKHERKWNAFAVISGELAIEVNHGDGGMSSSVLHAGDFLAVPPGQWHRFACYGGPAVALELYYPAELSEDIIRRDLGGLIS